MTAAFSADLTLAEAQRLLGEHDQWLPIDGAADATLQRLVGINSTGPLRLGFGAWRDLLLGVQFHNGQGELITAGGRTMKNVAGYDVTKFMVGQRGIFGKLLTLTARTYRRPAGALLAEFAPRYQKLQLLLPTTCRPQWAVMTPNKLLCGYMGDEPTLDYHQKALTHHAPAGLQTRSLEEDIAHRQLLWEMPEGAAWFRAQIPPARVAGFVRDAGVKDWSADAAFGIVLGRCEGVEMAQLRRLATEAGGSIVVTRDDGSLDPLDVDPAEREVLQRLKTAFDPEGKLAPLPV